jgi:hypothetical protein
MLTSLEAFIWSFSRFSGTNMGQLLSWDNDLVSCNLIIETLQHFSESGAEFMQLVYGYFGGDGLYNTTNSLLNFVPTCFGPGSRRDQNGFKLFGKVLVEWSILGALTHAVKSHQRVDYVYSRLQEFLQFLDAKRLDTKSLNPRIIAVCHPYNNNRDGKKTGGWMKTAKRVSGKHEERIMDNISQWTSQNGEDSETRGRRLDNEFNQIISSILDDDDVPEGIIGCLKELGLVEDWPRLLVKGIPGIEYTTDKGWRLPDGVIHPPVKFVDQLK